MKHIITLAACCFMVFASYSQTLIKPHAMLEEGAYPKALVSYDDFKELVTMVEKQRADRLVSFDEFLKMSQEENTVILDTRSNFRYKRKHIKGGIHLDFTDFTQENLLKLIPDPNTRILIYCNNNFSGDRVDFASKMGRPFGGMETQILSNRKPVMLALNVPTYINLVGYGYQNIYELDELVSVNDTRVVFEGSVVK